MANVKNELVDMLNEALEMEHQARIQYLTHATQISGLNAEPIIARLKELANDEGKHEEIFRTLIADYLDGVPTMEIAPTHAGADTMSILNINLKDEKGAIDFYSTIYKKIVDNKDQFTYEFNALEHGIRHIIQEEEEHVTELKTLIG